MKDRIMGLLLLFLETNDESAFESGHGFIRADTAPP